MPFLRFSAATAATAAALLMAAAPWAHAAPTPAHCPEVHDQLTEALAAAKQRVGRDGLVRVDFEVDAQGRARAVALDGTRRYLTPVRLAVPSLQCTAGAPQRYVLEVRFADSPAPTPMLAQARGG